MRCSNFSTYLPNLPIYERKVDARQHHFLRPHDRECGTYLPEESKLPFNCDAVFFLLPYSGSQEAQDEHGRQDEGEQR